MVTTERIMELRKQIFEGETIQEQHELFLNKDSLEENCVLLD